MKFISLLIAVAAIQFITSCETTGDPTQGGLWGWSESKALGRHYAKVYYIRRTDQDSVRPQAAQHRAVIPGEGMPKPFPGKPIKEVGPKKPGEEDASGGTRSRRNQVRD